MCERREGREKNKFTLLSVNCNFRFTGSLVYSFGVNECQCLVESDLSGC